MRRRKIYHLVSALLRAKRGSDKERGAEAQAAKRAAEATVWIARFTFVSVVTAGLTGWILWKQVSDSRENQRAFVSISISQYPEFSQITSPEGKPKVGVWHFLPNWTNNGNTATKNMITHVSVYSFCGPLPKNYNFPDVFLTGTEDVSPMPMDLPPKATNPGEPLEIDPTNINYAQFWASDITHFNLFIVGWATYNDAYSDTLHVVRFAKRIFITGDTADPTKIGFSYIGTRDYNCTDEECNRQGFPATWKPEIKKLPRPLIALGSDPKTICDNKYGLLPNGDDWPGNRY
jgi:hypothetical protein